jgi:beta-lactam-binding protein with PASTA domain
MPTMPNVVGMEIPDALGAMTAAGVRVTPFGIFQTDPVAVVWAPSTTAAPGVVTAQVPTAGTTGVAPNSAATLTASAYPIAVSYPAGGSQVDA